MNVLAFFFLEKGIATSDIEVEIILRGPFKSLISPLYWRKFTLLDKYYRLAYHANLMPKIVNFVLLHSPCAYDMSRMNHRYINPKKKEKVIGCSFSPIGNKLMKEMRVGLR